MHHFGVNYLKASTDKAKEPNWEKMLSLPKNGCFVLNLSCLVLVNFKMKEALAVLVMQVMQTFKSRAQVVCTCALFWYHYLYVCPEFFCKLGMF